MSTLFLHIGHAKTGSSYIQSSLAASRSALELKGLVYPEPGRGHPGNGLILLNMMQKGCCEFAGDIVLSSEFLFREFRDDNFCKSFENYIHETFSSVQILLLIRDPVSHASSCYQQSVKNRGYAGSVSDYLMTYNRPAAVDQVLDNLSKMRSVQTTVKNYSAMNNISSAFEGWLGVPEETLTLPPSAKVNRSLTRAELELQLLLNVHFGSAYTKIQQKFRHLLPDLEGDRFLPPVFEQEKMWTRLLPSIERVNSKVESHERYKRDLCEPTTADPEGYKFSQEQLEVIATVIAREAKRGLKGELARQRIQRLEQRNQLLKHRLSEMQNANSWQLSKPLRSVRTLLSRLRRSA